MGKLYFGFAFAGLIACSSNNNTPVDAHVNPIDAPHDAAKVYMDAPPSTYDLSCYQNAAPSPNAGTLTVGGTYTETTYAMNMIVMNGITGGSIKIFQANTATQVGATLASDASGNFTSAAIPSSAPVDVSITATSTGETPVNLYPPSPLVANATGLPVTTISTTNLSFLELAESITQAGSKGILAVAVVDCSNPPMNIIGATVTIQQGGTDVTGTTKIDNAMFGGELYFNTPAALTTVSATYNNMTFRAHDVTVVAGQMTATAVKPGY